MNRTRTTFGYQHRSALTLCALAGACATAHAGPGTVYPLVMGGDIYPPGALGILNTASAVDSLVVLSNGDWAMDANGTGTFNLLIRGSGPITPGGGTVWLYQTQDTHFPTFPMSSLDSVHMNAAGNIGMNIFLTATTSLDSGVIYNNTGLIQESTLATAPQFSANTPYIGWFEVLINDNNQLMMVASVDDPAIASSVDRALVRIDNPAGAATQTVIAKEGDTIFPGRLLVDVFTSPMCFAYSNAGFMTIMDLDGATTDDIAVMIHDGTSWSVALREGSPSFVTGRNWGNQLSTTAVDINNSGQWAARATLDNTDTTNDSVIVKSDGTIVAREGSNAPGALSAFQFTAFGTGSVGIDDAGNVYYFGDWNDPVTSMDTGLFRNGDLLVQEGVTVASTGEVVSVISAVQGNFDVSPNGRYVIFEGTLFNSVSGLSRTGALLLDLGGGCPAGCNLADITESGGTLEEPGCPDGQLTLDDILVFVDAYNDATGCPGTAPCNLADITESGGTLEEPGSPDGQLSLDDILVFVDAFNAGC